MPGILLLALAVLLSWGRAPASPSPAAAEVARLRAHFAQVERELLARDLSGLSASQRVERTRLIARLRAYSAAGRFPRNEHFPGRMVPYFRDAHGTLCAMAYLIDGSGGSALVDRVARLRNNAYLPELADEPGLASWLDAHGLTLAEAARIQPTYGVVDDEVTETYGIATLTVWGLGGIATGINLAKGSRPSRGFGLAGLMLGSVSAGMGIAKASEDGDTPSLAVINIAVGAFYAGTGLWAVLADKGERREPEPERKLTVAPIAMRQDGKASIGVAARIRFSAR